LNENGPACRCGNQGCWEVYASNTAGVRYYQEAAEALRGQATKKPAAMAGFEGVLQLAEQGDALAIQAVEKMAHYLGRGAAMLVSGLSPELIVFVGDVTRAWDRVGPIVLRVVGQRASTHPTIKIVPCDSATQPRVRGIIALVMQKHFGAPSVA
jgi:predicted NBD/HSP70 family sugar kinase